MTMSDRTIRVGTRTSSLAMAQTDEVVSILRSSFPDTHFQIVPITSDGDRRKDAPLLSLGRGTFAKRLELALLDGDIDMAVHSAKDLASALPDGLAITAYPERRDPRDVIVNRWGLPFADLPLRRNSRPPAARDAAGSFCPSDLTSRSSRYAGMSIRGCRK